MTLLPLKIYCARRWPLICFFTFGILVITIGSVSSVAAQEKQKDKLQAQVEVGQTFPATIRIRNRCSKPYHFRINNRAKFLRFLDPVKSVLVQPGERKPLAAMFDATELEAKIYQDKLIVECLDCKKCDQDKDEIDVQLAVIEREIPDAPFYKIRCCDLKYIGKPADPCTCFGEECYPGNELCKWRFGGWFDDHWRVFSGTFQTQILNASEQGQYYTRFAYFHAPALGRVFTTEPALAERAVRLANQLRPGLERMTNESGEQSRVTADLITEIGSFSEALANAAEKQGRPNLAADIRREIVPFTNKKLVGMTYPEVWKQIRVQNAPASDLTKSETTAIPEATPGKDIALNCCQCLGGGNTLNLSTVPTNNWTVNGKPVAFPQKINPGWKLNPGSANWVSPTIDGSIELLPEINYDYKLLFTVPSCIISQKVTLSGTYGGDNSVKVYLDNTLLSQCTTGNCFGSIPKPPPPFNNVIINPGAHILLVKVQNGGGPGPPAKSPTGMFLDAKIIAICAGQAPPVGTDPRRF